MKSLKIVFLLNMFLAFTVTASFAQVEMDRSNEKVKTEIKAKKADKQVAKEVRKTDVKAMKAERDAAKTQRKGQVVERNAERKVAQKERVEGQKATAKKRKVVAKERKKGLKKDGLAKPNNKAKKSTIETGNHRF